MQPVVTQLRYYTDGCTKTKLQLFTIYQNRVIVVSLHVISQLDVSSDAIGCPKPIAELTHRRV